MTTAPASPPTALLGGWGADAVTAVERAAARSAAPVQRIGPLALTGAAAAAPPATAGRWSCWVAGEMEAPAGALLAARLLATRGPAALADLRGAFVLIALDAERELAYVARDPLGARTLVHARLGDGVVFAEHEHDVLALLPTAPAPDPRAVREWAQHRTLPLGATFHAGVARVAPGQRIRLAADRRGATTEAGWTPTYRGTLAGSRAEIAEALRDAAFAAIERAARAGGAIGTPPRAGGRVGLRLSGGLDSACVAAGLAALVGAAAAGAGSAVDNGATTASAATHAVSGARSTTFGAGPLALAGLFPHHPAIDERAQIEATAAHAGLSLHAFAIEPPVALLAPALRHISRWRVPPGSSNLFLWERTAAAARADDVATLLDGEGGDELFGLAPQLLADRLRHGRVASAWELSGRLPGMGERPGRRARLRVLREHGLGGLRPSRDDAHRHDEHAARLDGPLWWRAHATALTHDADTLDVHGHLRREAVDGGVQRRHPFLHDVELLETALAIPPELQFDPRRDRPLLRDGLAGQIPEAVRTRHAKSYFGTLTTSVMAGPEGRLLADRLTAPDAPIRAYADEDALSKLLARTPAGLDAAGAALLWRLGTTDLWLRAQADPRTLDEVADALARTPAHPRAGAPA